MYTTQFDYSNKILKKNNSQDSIYYFRISDKKKV